MNHQSRNVHAILLGIVVISVLFAVPLITLVEGYKQRQKARLELSEAKADLATALTSQFPVVRMFGTNIVATNFLNFGPTNYLSGVYCRDSNTFVLAIDGKDLLEIHHDGAILHRGKEVYRLPPEDAEALARALRR